MRLLIIDSGLRHRGGHNFAFASMVAEDAAQRGIATIAFSNVSLPPLRGLPFEIRPTFTASYYSPVVRDRTLNFAHQNAQFRSELEAVGEVRPTHDDVIWVPTIGEAQLMGLLDWLAGLDPAQMPATSISLVLRAGVDANGDRAVTYDAAKAGVYRQLLGAEARLPPRVRLFGYGAQTARDFSLVTGRAVPAQPLLVAAPGGAPPAPEPRSVLLHIGAAHPRKGTLNLPAIVRLLARDAPEWKLVAHASPAARRGAGDALAELERLGESGAVELHAQQIGRDGYRQLLERARLVVLPYDAGHYRHGSSNTLWEAIAFDRPVAVPAGTYLEREARSWGAVHFAIDTSSAESVAAAVRDILASEPWDDAASRRAGERFRRSNGVHLFVDRLLGLETPLA